ncbi:MAG TPA: GntR family transcriptional regulator [Streptosporangiaceae bacterium]|nr:GntR family transcriptional regulator [Streptosporangiaceae bacterium]
MAGEAMYVVIADDLRRKIESGELAPGKQLPTEVELREVYGQEGMVSRNTVRDAIKLLVARGLVETRPGQGTFVMRKLTPFVSRLTADPEAGGVEDKVYESEVQRQGRSPEESRPRVEVQTASDLVRSQLQLDQGSQVISRHQQRRIDGTPFSMQTTFYPMALLQDNPAATRLLEARNVDGGMVDYLRTHLGINQVAWRDRIIARQPTPEERTFFDLPGQVQVSMFEFRRTGYGEDKKPIRLTITVYPADRNQFEIEAGDVPEPPALG